MESEGFLFDKTKRNLSEMGRRDFKSLHPPPCGRAAGKYRRPLAAAAWFAGFCARRGLKCGQKRKGELPMQGVIATSRLGRAGIVQLAVADIDPNGVL